MIPYDSSLNLLGAADPPGIPTLQGSILEGCPVFSCHRLPSFEPSEGSLDTITRQRRAEGDGHRLPLYSSDGAAGHRLTGRIKSIRPTALHICQNCEAYHLAIRGRKCYYEPQCLLIRFARFVDSIMAQVAYKVGVGD